MNKIAFFILVLVMGLSSIASDTIEPELLHMDEIFKDNKVNTKAAYEMLANLRMYIRIKEPNKNKKDIVKESLLEVEKALLNEPENPELWMLKGLFMTKIHFKPYTKDWYSNLEEIDHSFRNALIQDKDKNKISVQGLNDMLSYSKSETRVLVAKKLISDHGNSDYYKIWPSYKIDVYLDLVLALMKLGQNHEADKYFSILRKEFPAKYRDDIESGIKSVKRSHEKYLEKQKRLDEEKSNSSLNEESKIKPVRVKSITESPNKPELLPKKTNPKQPEQELTEGTRPETQKEPESKTIIYILLCVIALLILFVLLRKQRS